MKKVGIIFFILAISMLLPASAQPAGKKDTGKIEVTGDPLVKEMVQKYIDSQNGKLKGYRIQIHFSPEKNKANEMKLKFLSTYPEKRAYEIFETPYFKVRVGDFRTRLEAYKFLSDVAIDFPGAFIVTDDIDLPEL